MKLYLDACAIIYGMEGEPGIRRSVLEYITKAESAANGIVLTSRLSRLECRVKPLMDTNSQLLAAYEDFFARQSLRVIEIGPGIIERATELRVRYGFKTPDALHLATAIEEHADLFLTGDRALSRCAELNVHFPS